MKIVVLSLLVLVVGCSGGKNSTGFSIINDMVHSEAYEAQTINNNFENGQTNQLPPKGTVARGFMPHPVDVDGKPLMIKNPHEMTDYAWERGKMLYQATCAACHGDKGKADGLVVTEGGFPKPPSFKGRKWKKMDKYPAGHVYNVITNGIGNMKSHAQQLYPQDRWYVAEYVREKLMRKGKKKKKN